MKKNKPLGLRNSKQQNIEKGHMDYLFLLFILLILTIGLVSLFSASFANALEYHGNSYHFIYRQFIFGVGGVVCMLVASHLNYRILNHQIVVWALYIITLIMLASVFLFAKMNEAYRWIRIGGFITFQPSEIAKFSVVALLAHLINLNYDRMDQIRYGIIPPLAVLFPVLVLIYKEPHLSAVLLILMISATMLFVGGVRIRWFLLLGIGVVLVILLIVVSGQISYLMPRIQIWQDPWQPAIVNPVTGQSIDGHQTRQSLYAIASGGLMGAGIGGSQQKYLYLPELQNDYIFSIVCEELGWVGASIIIILFMLIVWRGFIIGIRCRDRFGSLLAIGLTSQIGFQVIMNILVVTNTIPVTGISLPFFSAGGTSLTMLLAQMGVVLAVSRYPKKTEDLTEREFIIAEGSV